jgi:alkylated DNA nucleotide flippase Atl1
MTHANAAPGDDPAYRPDLLEMPDFPEAVLGIVDQIPSGMVLAYGDIAEMLGEGGPRQVGSVMSRYGSSVSWWRVIRATGEASAGLQDEALAHWREEGTALVRGPLEGRRVDMRLARWDGRATVDRGHVEGLQRAATELCPRSSEEH